MKMMMQQHCISPSYSTQFTSQFFNSFSSPLLLPSATITSNFLPNKTKSASTRLRYPLRAVIQSEEAPGQPEKDAGEEEEEEEEYKVLTLFHSEYNRIVIIDTAKSRLLLLDSSSMLHCYPSFNSFLPYCVNNSCDFKLVLCCR